MVIRGAFILKVFGVNTDRVPDEYRGGAAALGFFDGVHRGHAQLISEAMRISKEKGAPSMVYTFDISPKNFSNSVNVLEITPLKTKTRVLESLGVDLLFVDEFSADFRSLTGEQFVEEVLHKRLGVTHVVVGFNYTFGVRAACGGDELREYCARFGIGVTQLAPFYVEGETEPVSSTLTRRYIIEGDMERTARLLGRPYFITSRVVHGQRIGTAMDVRTINQEPENNMVVPKKGVYISRSVIDGKWYKSMTNVGTRPTVNDTDDVRIETHIIDFNEDIYGKDVTVEFLLRIRDEKKFPSLDALKEQLMKDTKTTRDYFEKNKFQ